MKNPKDHIKHLHYSTCCDHVDNIPAIGRNIHCVLIEYVEES